jgi:hypothetical protein
MGRLSDGSNFGDCLTVGQAASYLGVSTATLRNWDRSGKLKPRRHPQNGYRIYLHEDLQALLRSADLAEPTRSARAPQIHWSNMNDTDHFVQFYERDDYLIESLAGYVAAALETGNSSIVIATLAHRAAVQRELMHRGIALSHAIETGRYVVLDAAETLAKFMVDGMPDVNLFNEQVGPIIEQLSEGGRRVHAFGEMVSLLWHDGHPDAAIRLEDLWNELARLHRFALLCAYPISAFDKATHEAPFNGICACHTRVIPAESYSELEIFDERMRAVARLQQKAHALTTELVRRSESDASSTATRRPVT